MQTIIETLQSVDIPITESSYALSWIDGVEGAAATVQVLRASTLLTPTLPVQLAAGDTLRIVRTEADSNVPSRLVGRPGPNWRSVPDTTTALPGEVLVIASDGSLDWAALPGGGGGDGVGIDHITQSGSQLTVHLTDGSTQGPFTLPAGPQGAQGPIGAAGAAGAAGADGASVTNATINASGHLILTLSNGDTIDAGLAQGSGGGGGGSGLPSDPFQDGFVGYKAGVAIWRRVRLSAGGQTFSDYTPSGPFVENATSSAGGRTKGVYVVVGSNAITGLNRVTLGSANTSYTTPQRLKILRLDGNFNRTAIVATSTNSASVVTGGEFTFAFAPVDLVAGGIYMFGFDYDDNGREYGLPIYDRVSDALEVAGMVSVGGVTSVTNSSGAFAQQFGRYKARVKLMSVGDDDVKNVIGPLDTADLPGFSTAATGTALTKTASGVSWLHTGAPGTPAAMTASGTVTSRYVRASAASGSITLTLPDGDTTTFPVLWIKRTDSTGANSVTLQAASGDDIDGSSTFVLSGAGRPAVILVARTNGWDVM